MSVSRLSVQELVNHYDLQPHPEGGYYRETYRARDVLPKAALPERFADDRSASTAIVFLLPAGMRSRWHRIAADEVWHFYLGDPLAICEVQANGTVKRTVLGPDVKNGERLQYVVPHGVWFAAEPVAGSEYSLVGCTVAPGFDFADFEMIDRGGLQQLLAAAPQADHALLARLS